MYGSVSTCCAALCCGTAAAATALWVEASLIICARPWRGCKWKLAWEREKWAKLTSRRKLYCGHVTGSVVLTVRQASSNSHLVHYFKPNLT
jgi:hypothetical protein